MLGETDMSEDDKAPDYSGRCDQCDTYEDDIVRHSVEKHPLRGRMLFRCAHFNLTPRGKERCLYALPNWKEVVKHYGYKHPHYRSELEKPWRRVWVHTQDDKSLIADLTRPWYPSETPMRNALDPEHHERMEEMRREERARKESFTGPQDSPVHSSHSAGASGSSSRGERFIRCDGLLPGNEHVLTVKPAGMIGGAMASETDMFMPNTGRERATSVSSMQSEKASSVASSHQGSCVDARARQIDNLARQVSGLQRQIRDLSRPNLQAGGEPTQSSTATQEKHDCRMMFEQKEKELREVRKAHEKELKRVTQLLDDTAMREQNFYNQLQREKRNATNDRHAYERELDRKRDARRELRERLDEAETQLKREKEAARQEIRRADNEVTRVKQDFAALTRQHAVAMAAEAEKCQGLEARVSALEEELQEERENAERQEQEASAQLEAATSMAEGSSSLKQQEYYEQQESALQRQVDHWRRESASYQLQVGQLLQDKGKLLTQVDNLRTSLAMFRGTCNVVSRPFGPSLSRVTAVADLQPLSAVSSPASPRVLPMEEGELHVDLTGEEKN